VEGHAVLTLVVYIPESHVEAVKAALFAAGAGRYRNYHCCAWQVRGTGQFRALPGSRPFVGSEGRSETVSEYRVEMLCPEERLKAVLAALRATHPYEEPAFAVLRNEAVPPPEA
jgi:hypothetical protein